MRGAAFEQHLREPAGRGADVERRPARRIEPEMVEAGDQLERRAGDIARRRIIDADVGGRLDQLAGLGRDRAAHPDRAPLDRVAGARTGFVKAPDNEKLVEPKAVGWGNCRHGLHWRRTGYKASVQKVVTGFDGAVDGAFHAVGQPLLGNNAGGVGQG